MTFLIESHIAPISEMVATFYPESNVIVMKCDEIIISPREAADVYSRLIFEDLNDQIPVAVDVSDRSVVIDDAAARAFIAQFERSGRRTYSLQLFLPCTSIDFDQKISQIEKDPFLRRFFATLIKSNGYSSISDFCSANFYNTEDLDQIVGIAKAVEGVSPGGTVGDADLHFFIQSLQNIIAQQDMYSARIALENMKRKVTYDVSSKREAYTRTLNIRDMACHLMTIASLNDYKSTLEKNFSPSELVRLPKDLTELLNLKALLVNGKVNSIYQPEAVNTHAMAKYDQEYNTVVYPETISPGQLFVYQRDTRFIPAQIINHELRHALSDWKKANLPRHKQEAEAHILEVFYSGLKLGVALAEKNYQNIIDPQAKGNAPAFKKVEALVGINSTSFMQMFPESEMAYRYIAIQSVKNLIAKVRAGEAVRTVPLKDVADAYALSNSAQNFLTLIAREGSVDQIVKLLSEGKKLSIEIVEIADGGRGRMSVKKSKVTLPDELDRLGVLSHGQMGALEALFYSSPRDGYGTWKELRKNMILYAVCKHRLDSTFDVRGYIKDTIMPFLKLEYTFIRNKPDELGIE